MRNTRLERIERTLAKMRPETALDDLDGLYRSLSDMEQAEVIALHKRMMDEAANTEGHRAFRAKLDKMPVEELIRLHRESLYDPGVLQRLA